MGTEVIGTDISPIQESQVPPNVQFLVTDCTEEWTFSPQFFDFIHMRHLLGSIADWTKLFKEAYRATEPGGWVESVESSPHMLADDGTVAEGSAIFQWGKFFEEGGRMMGRSFMVVEEEIQRAAMEAAGFVDVTVMEFKVSCPSSLQPRKTAQLLVKK